MTGRYLIGELSVRLERLQAAVAPRAARDVAELRSQVETSSAGWLPWELTRALTLADRACWQSLGDGDADAFARQAAIGEDLLSFGVCARLLHDDYLA